MGLFDDLFRRKAAGEPEKSRCNDWTSLETMEQLENLDQLSGQGPQIIFKHSTRCGISRMVMNIFREGYQYPKEAADLYYLDIIEFRALSDHVARKYGIAHQSPQLLIIRKGEVIAHDSHGGINDLDLAKYL